MQSQTNQIQKTSYPSIFRRTLHNINFSLLSCHLSRSVVIYAQEWKKLITLKSYSSYTDETDFAEIAAIQGLNQNLR